MPLLVIPTSLNPFTDSIAEKKEKKEEFVTSQEQIFALSPWKRNAAIFRICITS
jgi:hypothetical protein